MLKYSLLFVIVCAFSNISRITCGPSISTLALRSDAEADVLNDNDKLPPVMNQTEGCGGVLSANRGYIGYNMNSTYRNNERCVWTIRTDRVATMIQLRWQGFVTDDYLTVYGLNSSGALQRLARFNKYTGNKIHEFLGPVIFLTFTSDQYGEGTGFYLEYFGFAYPERTGYTFNNYHLEGESGSENYPAPDFPKNEHVTYVLTPAANTSLRIAIGHVDIGNMYAGCPHNYLSVHQLFQSTFDLRLRYCEPENQNTAIISSSSPILIAFFATTSPIQTGFSFSWENVENK